MATFYVDFENGNDANDGTTFANRWKTLTNGATAARIGPGDEIRMMGSPAPTSLGQNGVWTSSALQATKSITSSTNATPIAITCTAHGYSTGDTVVITGHTTNTNANGTWEITVTGANTFTLDGSVGNGVGGATGTARLRNNTRVMLTSAVTQNIASTGPGRAAWTASANVTATLSSSNIKEHNVSDYISIAGAFTTGKVAYWTLPSTLDLSGFQQVSFWVIASGGGFGTISAGALQLRLCSDTIGDTAVNTLSLPLINGASRQQAVTIDNGAALGSSIASIALYVNTDISAGVVDLYFSNIIACKASSAADSLTLTSLIGKNTTGETWWGIQSINGRRVMLDADTNATPTITTVRGYYGTSGTVTTWKRETIKLGPAAGSTTALQTIQDSGTDGSPITFSGGWDQTSMSTQSLETWIDGLNGNGYAVTSGRNFVTFSNIAAVRFSRAFSCTGEQYGVVLSLKALNNNVNPAAIQQYSKITCEAIAANSQSLGLANATQGAVDADLGKVYSNGANGIDLHATPATRLKLDARNNGGFDVNTFAGYSGLSLYDSTMGQNAQSISLFLNGPGLFYVRNTLMDEANEVVFTTTSVDAIVFSHDHDKTSGNHKIFLNGALISSATDQRKTASGFSWKMQPTNQTIRNSSRPVILPLAKVAVAANSLVTVKAWMRRDNTGLTMRLVCKGGQISGVASDVVSAMTAAADTWEELTITFTPSVAGVVEITAEAWGGTTFSGWVDDMTISQA